MIPKTCTGCGAPFLVKAEEYTTVRFGPCCDGNGQAKRGEHLKFVFTPAMDERIKSVYRTQVEKGAIKKLAEEIGIPRYRVSRRAREIHAYEPRIKESDWSEKEIALLEKAAYMTPERIRIKLRKAGFTRSTTGIILKRKRMKMLKNLEGQSAHNLAGCFGVDVKAVTGWLDKGYLAAKKRGTERTEKQGGDMWFIKRTEIRKFIIDSIGVIDIRKVDKFWFVDILTNRRASQ